MRHSAVVAAILLWVSGSTAICSEEFPPCIPLNETLSVCTDVEGIGVSFIDATPTAAMGSARLQGNDKVSLIWAAYWEIDTPLNEYAHEQALAALEFETGYELHDPASLVLDGLSGVQYDLSSKSKSEQDQPPRSILFLDTGAGFAILNGFAQDPNVTLENIHQATQYAARIFRVAE